MATFFDCPFCDARQTIDEASVGRLSGCPNCKRTVWLFPNVNVPYDQRLSSNWYYETDRFLRLQITAGPIDDLQLVRMIDAGRIAPQHEIRSHRFTRNEWIRCGCIRMVQIRQLAAQQLAEKEKRRRQFRARQKAVLDPFLTILRVILRPSLVQAAQSIRRDLAAVRNFVLLKDATLLKSGPRPLPVREIVWIAMLLSLGTLFLQWLGWRSAPILACRLGLASIFGILAIHALGDNLRTSYRNFHLFSTFFKSLGVWLPFFIVLLPGIALVAFIDNQIDAAVHSSESIALGTIEDADQELEYLIASSQRQPFRLNTAWFESEMERLAKQKAMLVAKQTLVAPAPWWIRSFFGLIHAFLQASQLLLYTTVGCVLLRSYLYLFARTALFGRAQIQFCLP
ncbi:MAG: hypothetical protein KDB03_27890 [Planctomycetales bacterium]|nr:hypothetical protein [Planctomycetales bacterium]